MHKIFHESPNRSVVKALSFRFIIFCVDAVLVYGLTRRVDVTAGIVGATSIIHTIIYFLHERSWNEIHWGKHHKHFKK